MIRLATRKFGWAAAAFASPTLAGCAGAPVDRRTQGAIAGAELADRPRPR